MKRPRTRILVIGATLIVLLGASVWGNLTETTPGNYLPIIAKLLFPTALIGLAGWAGYIYLRPTNRPVTPTTQDSHDPDPAPEEAIDDPSDDDDLALPTQELPLTPPESTDTAEAAPIERSRVMSGSELRQSLLGVKRLLVWMMAVWLFATGIIVSQLIDPDIRLGWYVFAGAAVIALLGLGDIPLRKLLRKRHNDVSDGIAREDILYRECPHFTLILGVTVIQAILWLVVLAASVVEHFYSARLPLWSNLYLQWLVTIVNIYLIAKRYTFWKGTTYTWTKNHYTVVHQRDVFFGLMNASSKSYVASTLVRVEATQGILEQPPLFERRGTATIRTQDETEPAIIVPYVYDPVRFREAGNLATSRN